MAEARDIVVVGASAGGVEALMSLVGALPSDTQAALFVVLHVPRGAPSALPSILTRAGPLAVSHPRDGELIEHGTILVAPPDRHMVLEKGRVRLTRGPRENGHRPGIDPLFRSAARAFGPRVVGVILSGVLDDGVEGLGRVKRSGGLAVVQDPGEAIYAGMPEHAAAAVAVDHTLRAADIAALIGRLATEDVPAPMPARASGNPHAEGLEMNREPEGSPLPPGSPSGYSCPDCGGVLWEIDQESLVRFRCRVGHAWSGDNLLYEQAERLEEALWAALRALEERAALARRLAARARARHERHSAGHFDEQARDNEERAEVVREAIAAGRVDPAADEPAGPVEQASASGAR